MAELEARWIVFRIGLLRSAGFPFDWIDELSSKTLEQDAMVVMNAYARRERARADALLALRGMRRGAESADMRVLNRATRSVRSRKTVVESHAGMMAVTEAWNIAVADFDSLFDSVCAELSAKLPAEHERESRLLLEHVTSDYFKDAVLLGSLLSYGAYGRASNDRFFRRSKDESAAYRYLQRFCAKNETGGSVGPLNLMAIGAARDDATASSDDIQYSDDPVLGRIEYVADGDGRSAKRRTLMSYWAACELGRSIINNAVDPCEVRQPYRLFGMPKPELTEADAHLLSHVDGQRTISALASDLGWSAESVETSLSRLAGFGLVSDTWRVPDFTTDSGEDVRKLAAQIGTPEATRASKLVADVKRFAQAPLEDRPALLSAITREFSRATDKPAWRGPGKLKSDRTVLYEEATGNIRAARVDPDGAQRLADRLSTALEFLASLAIEQRAAGQSLLAQELSRRNVSELPATEVREMAVGTPQPSFDHATLRERFLGLVDPSASCVEFDRRDLAEVGLIRGDLNDWPIFGAADLMLTGPGAAAGPGLIILSELHHIWPTLGCWARALYDDDELGNEELWRIVTGELTPAVPTLQEIARHGKATDSSPYGHTVLCLDTGMAVPGTATVLAERAVVRRWQNGFIGLHDPASQRDLWLLPEYDDSGVNAGGLINCAIPALSLEAFTIGSYTPRIVIDGVVVQRRRWQVGVADIPSARGRVPTEREWLAVQMWRQSLGLPKCAYFLLDTERKPIYLDLSSVLSVTNFLRCVRSGEQVVLTEALPDPQRLWLRTKDGSLTSEIRTLVWRDRRAAFQGD